jgi:hypothetical protein
MTACLLPKGWHNRASGNRDTSESQPNDREPSLITHTIPKRSYVVKAALRKNQEGTAASQRSGPSWGANAGAAIGRQAAEMRPAYSPRDHKD